MTQDKTGPDATPRIGLDLGRQIFDDPNSRHQKDQQSGASEEAIRHRAYEIWDREGRTGDPQDHWLEAERGLRTEEDARAASDRPEATVEDASPVEAVEALEATTEDKPKRRRSSSKG